MNLWKLFTKTLREYRAAAQSLRVFFRAPGGKRRQKDAATAPLLTACALFELLQHGAKHGPLARRQRRHKIRFEGKRQRRNAIEQRTPGFRKR